MALGPAGPPPRLGRVPVGPVADDRRQAVRRGPLGQDRSRAQRSALRHPVQQDHRHVVRQLTAVEVADL
ncbi:hypothetical protein, partial [Streptomyces sp. NPDC001843]|uniref:hypothetical protein n=1 Tax=Streptomyces sp. NPDC001843 TaxID=3364617 RepID=UPI003695B6A8